MTTLMASKEEGLLSAPQAGPGPGPCSGQAGLQVPRQSERTHFPTSAAETAVSSSPPLWPRTALRMDRQPLAPGTESVW